MTYFTGPRDGRFRLSKTNRKVYDCPPQGSNPSLGFFFFIGLFTCCSLVFSGLVHLN